MVAELCYRSANGALPPADPAILRRRDTIARPMLRGALMAISGDVVMRAASTGVMGAAVVGDVVLQGARASGWCERRQASRGRRPVDKEGVPVTPPKAMLPIHSQIPAMMGFNLVVLYLEHYLETRKKTTTTATTSGKLVIYDYKS